jgi:hypothetical protein
VAAPPPGSRAASPAGSSQPSVGGWSSLRRMERKAVRQLTRSARADPRVTAGVVLASSLQDHRVGVWCQGRGGLLAGPSTGRALVGGADASMAERAFRAAGVAEPRRHVWLCDVDCGHGFWTRGERLKGVPAWVADTLVFGQANDPVDFLLCLNWAEHQHRKPSCPGGRLRTRARTTCAARGREVARRRTSGRRGGVGSRPRCLARPASGRPAGGRTPTDRPRSGAARRPASVAP